MYTFSYMKFVGQFSVLFRRLATVNVCEKVTINKIVSLYTAMWCRSVSGCYKELDHFQSFYRRHGIFKKTKVK